MEEQAEASLVEEFGLKLKKKRKPRATAPEKKNNSMEAPIALDEGNLGGSTEDCNGPGYRVSEFDYSVENHFRAMETISKLCGEEANEDDRIEGSDISRLSSATTFLREWKHFNYEPTIIRFSCETGSPHGKDVSQINLPQFSSAIVPKQKGQSGGTTSLPSSKDFVMNTGGHVLALDWCHRNDEKPDCPIKCEFIAIATQPPGSSYHKIGAPLTGRGVVQIWCLLNVSERRRINCAATEEKSTPPKKPRGRPRRKPIEESLDNLDSNSQFVKALSVQNPEELFNIQEATKRKSTQPKRLRGRPRKKSMEESLDNLDSSSQFVKSLTVQYPENSLELLGIDRVFENTQEATKEELTHPNRARGRPSKKRIEESLDNIDSNSQFVQDLTVKHIDDSSELLPIDRFMENTQEHTIQKGRGKKRKGYRQAGPCNSALKTSMCRNEMIDKARSGNDSDNVCPQLLTQNVDNGSSCMDPQMHSSEQDPMTCNDVSSNISPEISLGSCSIPKDVALPRVVLCLAHNGKVAWDVKWRPSKVHDSKCKHRMGYLAVLLGNGSLEVWEVPSPHTIEVIYSSSQSEGTDPRFVKLEPVFRCSILKCGDRQSIPLTLEWSASSSNEYLLAGCHDGTVALWNFSTSGSYKDTRPMLCFSADTVPIRALAWAPVESDPECANVVVTAGHGGLKFWDIRDPFRPLWDFHPVPKFIYSLDWLPDPRCVILSFDDGTMRIISLVKAAYDVPVTGKPYVGTKQQGSHCYNCSSFAVWSVQVSRLTGMVAYCSADGTVLRFQLTAKAVEKDPTRNRAPHFLCGSLTKEESAITVSTPLPNTPVPFKKPLNESGSTSRSMPELPSKSNQSKKTNDRKAKSSAADLCYGDDPGMESESEETLASPTSKKTPKSRSSSKKRLDNDQALVCVDEEQTSVQGPDSEKGETGIELELFPPKAVAMHKVRWNMNMGSERWLCYGGAAGIVRCQEIDD